MAGLEIDDVPAKEELHPIDFGWVVPALWHYPVVVDYAAAAKENYLVLLPTTNDVGGVHTGVIFTWRQKPLLSFPLFLH